MNVTFWSAFCKAHGTPRIDLHPAVMQQKRPAETFEAFFIPADVHWNDVGHQLVAERWMALHEATARDEALRTDVGSVHLLGEPPPSDHEPSSPADRRSR